MPEYVAYYRVSTARQGESGLGLDAQRADVARYVAASGRIIAEYTEVETGKRAARPQLDAALAECRVRRATLLVAKLDRLARNVYFTSGLMRSGVDFVAADNPHATRLTIHILAAVAEDEAERISARTRAALAAAKARGVWLGAASPSYGARTRILPAHAAAAGNAARRAQAESRAADVMQYVQQARAAGAVSLRQLAAALTARGVRTPRGLETWTATQVARAIERATGG